MEEENILSKLPSSIGELKTLLHKYPRPSLDEVDKYSMKTLLTGFQLIVEGFETKSEETNGDLAIQWLRFYLRVQSITSISEKMQHIFSKTIPIAITYIMGWLQYGPIDEPDFLNEILPLTLRLVRLTDPAILKNLENFVHGIISILWLIIDKVQTYYYQLHTLDLFILLLKNLSTDFQFKELSKMIENEPIEIKFLLFDLAQQTRGSDVPMQGARKILNLHNDFRKSVALSFHCQALYLGKQIKFLKPSYDKKFWFDMNLKSKTLAFEGRTYIRKNKTYRKLDFSLKVSKISVGSNNKAIIQFEPPAEVNGSLSDLEADLQNINLAYIEFTKKELSRFESSLKATEFSKYFVHVRTFCFGPRFDNVEEQNTPKKPLLNTNTKSNPSQIKVQKVSPLNKTPLDWLGEEERISEKESAPAALHPPDEYDDLEVSDAEPCQSYKNFQTARPRLFEELPSSNITKKRAHSMDAPNNDGDLAAPARKKPRQKSNGFSPSEEPSTSKAIRKLLATKRGNTTETRDFSADSGISSSPVDTNINLKEIFFNDKNQLPLHNLPAWLPSSATKNNQSTSKQQKSLQANINKSCKKPTKYPLKSVGISSKSEEKANIDESSNAQNWLSVSSCFKRKSPKHQHATSYDKLIVKHRSDSDTSSLSDDDVPLFEIQKRIKKRHSPAKSLFALSNKRNDSRFIQQNAKKSPKADTENVTFASQDSSHSSTKSVKMDSTTSNDDEQQASEIRIVKQKQIHEQIIEANSNDTTENSALDQDDGERFKIMRASYDNMSCPKTSRAVTEVICAKNDEHEKVDDSKLAGKENNLIYHHRSDDDDDLSSEDDDEILTKAQIGTDKSKINASSDSNCDEFFNKNNTQTISNMFDILKQQTAGKPAIKESESEVVEIRSDEENNVEHSFEALKKDVLSTLKSNENSSVSSQFISFANSKPNNPYEKTLTKSSSKKSNVSLPRHNFRQQLPQVNALDHPISSSGGSVETLTRFNRCSFGKKNPRRLFAEQCVTDSDTSAGEFTEIFVMARTKKRRHTICEPMFSMFMDQIGDVLPSFPKYFS